MCMEAKMALLMLISERQSLQSDGNLNLKGNELWSIHINDKLLIDCNISVIDLQFTSQSRTEQDIDPS